MTEPRVSVVIATRNRAEHLPETLHSYECIATELPWELIVVDNGSTDATVRVLAEFAAQTSLDFRPLSEPRPAASRARNTGVRAATGEIIALTDDDCYPRPDYIDALVACFADSSIGYLGGRIELHDPGDAPVTLQLGETRVTLPKGSFVPAGLVQGANMAMRRSALESVGGFDELLGAGTRFLCEDLDLVSRASAAGFAGGYDPRIAVAHHHRRRDLAQVAALVRGYDFGRGAYYTKCLLDPRRRGTTWRPWLRSLLREFGSLPLSAPARARVAAELRGAVAYLRERSGTRAA